ncbi:MAG TPA: hypothetical protein VF815_45295 [Myxococcaceae bacterium]|jgi:hypothetical protein
MGTGYPGKFSAAVFLAWKGPFIANAVGRKYKDYHYVIANELVTGFTIRANAGKETVMLTRKVSPGVQLFDHTLNTFLSDPTAGAEFDKLIASGPGTKCLIDLEIKYSSFFDAMLDQMTLQSADLHNLAYPKDSDTILKTFTHSRAGGKVSIKYKEQTLKLTELPCTLLSSEVKPGLKGTPPEVKLFFLLTPQRKDMRNLIAMDWSMLARHGKKDTYSQPHIKLWWNNVYIYLVNNTDLTRGEKFRSKLVSDHKAMTAKELATSLRNSIDRYIVTANHWGEARESFATEKHQRLLSDLFGTLHQQVWLASPVNFLRSIQKDFALSTDPEAALILQYGVGHCGEHAQVSFSVLGTIIKTPGAKVSHAVYTGNANIDHAFVVFDLDVDEVIATVATNAKNTRVKKGEEIQVWNLREALKKNTARVGYVMDPYLDPKVMKPTAKELLTALNNANRKKTGKDTDFLAFVNEAPYSVNQISYKTKPEAERKKLIKNI